MEKAKIENITFDEEDAKLIKLRSDLLLKAKAIQYSILPKLNVVLEEALSRVRKCYGIEVFKEDSIVTTSPNFRPNRKNELKVDYTWAITGITGTRKPIWNGFKRTDGKPVAIIGYSLGFAFSENGLDLMFTPSNIDNLTDDSLTKPLVFLRRNSHVVQTILNISGIRYRHLYFDEEDNAIIAFDKFVDRLVDAKVYDLDFWRDKKLPIGLDDLNDLIDSFIIFYPIYDSVLRIAKGQKDIFKELISKLKIKHLSSNEEVNTEEENGNQAEHILTEEEKDLLSQSIDGKKIAKAGIRWQVMERDDFKCVACGVSAKDGAILHVDHIIPRSKGGKDVMDNYQTLCHQCNIGKSNKSQVNLRKE